MSSADTAIQDFGRAMGMPRLAFNENGVVRLRFEKSGTLSIERTPQGSVVVLLARPLDNARDGALARALTLCHHDQPDRLRPNAGIAKDGSLVFCVRLEDNALDRSSFEDAFDFLRRLHDKAAG